MTPIGTSSHPTTWPVGRPGGPGVARPVPRTASSPRTRRTFNDEKREGMEDVKSTALVPVESGEIVPLDLLAAEAEELAERAQAATTRVSYQWWWQRFERWCAARGLQAMPAQMGTVVLWVTEISNYGTGPRTVLRGRNENKQPVTLSGKPLSRSSVQQAVAALQSKHRDAGHGSAIDRKHPALAKLLKAINRSKPAVVRKAEAFTVVDMLELLPTINVGMNRVSAVANSSVWTGRSLAPAPAL
jgi:hypothetical protein